MVYASGTSLPGLFRTKGSKTVVVVVVVVVAAAIVNAHIKQRYTFTGHKQ